MPTTLANRRIHLQRIFLMFFFIALIAIAATVSYLELIRLRVAPIITWQSERTSLVASELSRDIGHIRVLVTLLKNSGPVRDALERDRPIDNQMLKQVFTRFARANNHVSQVRWIDNDGLERVRVNFIDGKAEMVPPEELQTKMTRYYFYETMRMGVNEVYVSPLDLNEENGQPVIPFEPTLRTGIRTGFGDKLHTGILIINFNLADFFADLRTMHSQDSQLQLLNHEGYWLLNPDPNREWGFQLNNLDMTIAKQAPQQWQHIRDNNSLLGEVWHNRLYSTLRIAQAFGNGETDNDRLSLWIVAQTREGVLNHLRLNILAQVLVVCLLIGSLGIWVLLRLNKAEQLRESMNQQIIRERDALEHAYRELSTAHGRQQQLQDELVESRKLSALGMMVAGVSHELNTPTGGALMLLSDLKKQVNRLLDNADSQLQQAPLQRMQHGIDLAENNLQRASQLIRSFKRIASDRVAHERGHFELKQVVDDLLLSLTPRLKHTHVQVITEIPDNLEMDSYPGVISQILQNLIDNALEHGFDANATGSIHIQAERIGGTPPWLELQVSDDGKGVAPEMANSLFDPFITSKRGEGHTGLGLHMVQQWIANSLHGSIRVNSEPGQGTCFTIRIPLTTLSEEEASTDNAES